MAGVERADAAVLPMGVQVFPAIKIAVIRQLHMYCSLSVKITIAAWHARSWKAFVCICFHVCGRQTHKYPQLGLHGWRRHYTGQYRSSGSLFHDVDSYIYQLSQ